jgi:hypothetical protein
MSDTVIVPIGPRGWTGVLCGQLVPEQREYFHVLDLVTVLGRCPSAIRQRCVSGVLPAVKVAGKWVVRATALGAAKPLERCGGAIVREGDRASCEKCGRVPDWA